jgi:hypothetical protein
VNTSERIQDLEGRLKDWGLETGNNLAVGFVNRKDPKVGSLVNAFNLEATPAIVMTGDESLASILRNQGKKETVFLRLDDQNVMSNIPKTMDALGRAYNLFLKNDIAGALKMMNQVKRGTKIERFLRGLGDAVEKVGKFLDDHNIKIGMLGATFEITKPGK